MLNTAAMVLMMDMADYSQGSWMVELLSLILELGITPTPSKIFVLHRGAFFDNPSGICRSPWTVPKTDSWHLA